MVVWNTELVQHNHALHTFLARIDPEPENIAALISAFMGMSKSERLPVWTQRTDSNGVTTWEVWDRGEHIGTFDTQAEADALCLLRQPRCPDCADYERRTA